MSEPMVRTLRCRWGAILPELSKKTTFSPGRAWLIVRAMRRRLLLIASDRTSVETVRLALRNAQSLRLVATLDARGSARRALRSLQPHVVVIDDGGHRTNTLRRIGEAVSEARAVTVVLLTGTHDPVWLRDAHRAGASVVAARRPHPAVLGPVLLRAATGALESEAMTAPASARVLAWPERQARTSA